MKPRNVLLRHRGHGGGGGNDGDGDGGSDDSENDSVHQQGDERAAGFLAFYDGAVLCDLDASRRIGESVWSADEAKVGSSGYMAPEVARHLDSVRCSATSPPLREGAPQSPLRAAPSQDVWSLGAVLFELCTGRHLFRLDIADDELADPSDRLRLFAWHTIPDDDLAEVFRGCAIETGDDDGDDDDDDRHTLHPTLPSSPSHTGKKHGVRPRILT